MNGREEKQKGLIAWFARNGVAANLLMVAIIVSGTGALYRGIPLEVFPEFDSDFLSVRVAYRGATPEEVEKSIVIPIEEAIADVEGVEQIKSTAGESSGTVTVEVDDSYDRREVLDDVKARVDAMSNLPGEAEKPVVGLADRYRSVISVVLSGDMSERDLRELAVRVRDEIQALPSVSQTEVQGVRVYEISIEIEEATLQRFGLSFDSVARAIRESSVDIPAGVLKTEVGEITLRTRGQAYTGEDFARIVVHTNPDGSRLMLDDIATIKDGFNENPFVARLNGERCVLIAVSRQGNESAIEIADDIKAYMAQANLPPGVTIAYWSDMARIVRARLETLLESGWKSVALVFLVLALFLRLSLAFWVAVGIPVCLLGAISLMPAAGVSINIVSLFGFILILGVVVDDAIVTGENICSRQAKGDRPMLAAIRGTKEVARPVTFGVLTTMLAFVPLLFGTGFHGKAFGQIAIIVILVLGFSLVESKLILPAHLSHAKLAGGHPVWLGWFYGVQRFFAGGLVKFVEVVYRPFLEWALRWRYAVGAVFLGALALLIGMMQGGHVSYIPFPRVPSERPTARLRMQEGTSHETTAAHIKRMREVVETLQEKYRGADGNSVIEKILSSAGGQGVGSSRRGPTTGEGHLGEISFYLEAPEKRGLDVTTEEIVGEWRKGIGMIVGAKELTFRAEIGRSGDPIDIQLTGNDPDQLAAAARVVREHLEVYDGLFDIADTLDDSRDEIQLRIKPEAEQFGLTLLNLARQVRQAFSGEEVQRIQRGRDEVKVLLRYPERRRKTLASLEEMRIRTDGGAEVPFSSVAEAYVGPSLPRIERVDRRRAVNVTADADREVADVPAIRLAAEEKIKEILVSYPGVYFSYEGEAKEERESGQTMMLGIAIVIFGIYALLAIPFRSYLQPFIVMLVIPFGLIGAALGHFLMGMPLSMLSYFGMLALAGVVVNDSLVLVDYVNQRRGEGMPLLKAVREAGGARFRAIILTSITTFAGLIPLIFEKSTQAQFLIPMAVSLGFGILFATAITLVLVPISYVVLEDLKGLLAERPRAERVPEGVAEH